MARSPMLQVRMINRAEFVKACAERGDNPNDLIRAFANHYIAEHEAAKRLETKTPRTDNQ